MIPCDCVQLLNRAKPADAAVAREAGFSVSSPVRAKQRISLRRLRLRVRRAGAPCALQPDGDVDQAERGRRNAGNAAGLADGARPHSLQRFPHLAREAADGAVLEPLGNGDGLGGFELLDGLLLLVEIAGELDLGLDRARLVAQLGASDGVVGMKRGEFGQQWLGGDFVAQGGEHGLDGDFRPLEQLRPG